MTKKDIDNIISIICLNDEDFEKLIISPAYLKKELEALALEQEPCEYCISRQAVDALVDELARAISDERCCMSRGRSTATIMQDILDLPSATPQPKMGHWKKKEDDTCWEYVCSECGQGPLKNRWNDGDVLSTFCPNCGAKMQEVEE